MKRRIRVGDEDAEEYCSQWITEYLGCGYMPLSGGGDKEDIYVTLPVYKIGNDKVQKYFMVRGADTTKYPSIDKENQDRSLDENAKGQKICINPTWMDWLKGEQKYEIVAIRITPHLHENYEPNFCYYGTGSASYQAKKAFLDAAFFAIDLIIPIPVVSIATGFAYAYLDEKIDESYRWPNNPDW